MQSINSKIGNPKRGHAAGRRDSVGSQRDQHRSGAATQSVTRRDRIGLPPIPSERPTARFERSSTSKTTLFKRSPRWAGVERRSSGSTSAKISTRASRAAIEDLPALHRAVHRRGEGRRREGVSRAGCRGGAADRLRPLAGRNQVRQQVFEAFDEDAAKDWRLQPQSKPASSADTSSSVQPATRRAAATSNRPICVRP